MLSIIHPLNNRSLKYYNTPARELNVLVNKMAAFIYEVALFFVNESDDPFLFE